MTNSTCRKPRSGFQSLLSTLTQISPDLLTLGCQILVVKKPLGGEWGKSSGRTSFMRNRPPSKGVPARVTASTAATAPAMTKHLKRSAQGLRANNTCAGKASHPKRLPSHGVTAQAMQGNQRPVLLGWQLC